MIAPLQPHKSWYGQFWYAERSPLGALADRLLLFAIVALSLLAGGMSLIRHHHPPAGDVRVTDSSGQSRRINFVH